MIRPGTACLLQHLCMGLVKLVREEFYFTFLLKIVLFKLGIFILNYFNTLFQLFSVHIYALCILSWKYKDSSQSVYYG